jgi:hypothetical protein
MNAVANSVMLQLYLHDVCNVFFNQTEELNGNDANNIHALRTFSMDTFSCGHKRNCCVFSLSGWGWGQGEQRKTYVLHQVNFS